jgi:hypothetical protein
LLTNTNGVNVEPTESINELQWRLDGARAEAEESGHELEADFVQLEPDYPPEMEWDPDGAPVDCGDPNEGIDPWR